MDSRGTGADVEAMRMPGGRNGGTRCVSPISSLSFPASLNHNRYQLAPGWPAGSRQPPPTDRRRNQLLSVNVQVGRFKTATKPAITHLRSTLCSAMSSPLMSSVFIQRSPIPGCGPVLICGPFTTRPHIKMNNLHYFVLFII